MSLKILSVVGTRPNFVKIAPLVAAMQRRDVRPILAHTGQHYDREMSECFLRDLGIPAPDFILRTAPSAPVDEIASGLRSLMLSSHPDAVLVVGDVNSTLAGARAAASLGLPVAHVEAGLRSFDPAMPEEENRIATDALSTLLFASEPSAVANLMAEGHARRSIFLTGNVMIDTLRRFLAAARRSSVVSQLGLDDGCGRRRRYAVATLHRQGTVDSPTTLKRIWGALEEVGAHVPVIFPAHPRTRARLRDAGLDGGAGADYGIRVTGPLPYLDFVCLESSAALVMTDSGGVQEETTAMGVPCLTLRHNTERPITVSEGTNQVVGLDPAAITSAARAVLAGKIKAGRIPKLWDGRSAPRIVDALCRYFGSRLESAPGKTRSASASLPATPACPSQPLPA